MVRPFIILVLSAFYLAASTSAQSPPQQVGTYNNVLKYFKEHPLIDQNGTPTQTFHNVLKKVATMPKNNQPISPAVAAAVNPYRAYSPYNPYTQYQAYAQAQLRQAQAQAQAKSVAVALSPPSLPAPAPAPAPAPQAPQSPPAPQPEPAPESKPENEPHPDPNPNPPPEQPNPEPAPAPEPEPEPKVEENPPAPAPEPKVEENPPAPEPEQAQAPVDENKPAESDQAQPAAENNPSQPAQLEPEPVTPAGDVPSNSESDNTLEVSTEVKDLAIPPASENMNDPAAVPGTDGMLPDGTLPNGTLSITNEVMGSVGIDGSTFSYSSIDMSQATPPSNARPSAVQPTTYIPPMASTATRFNDLSCLVLLLLNTITLVF